MNTAAILTACPRAVRGDDWNALTYIYEDDVNISIGRNLIPQSLALTHAVSELLHAPQTPALRMSGTPDQCKAAVLRDLPNVEGIEALADAVHLVTDAFSTLFDLHKVGLRLDRLDKAMCPRFHVDRVPVRLVLTFAGPATEWLSEDNLNRNLLSGAGNPCRTPAGIQQLQAGDIALLKGEEWDGNEGRGLVHRSPAPAHGEKRLMLTLDFA
ncbi:MAG: hypothetical protein CMI02_08280 [Oceanospirillaceae bacterium]|nr:hypothetical protein [Oceanospirillaceae bacterium]MBT12018.1 hypothetical protein [Oceanospirillaceae bacterium]|tara:strand:+ start:104583 stop:105218 length:636 start_codon:yes stop_codon:yes gene_type:complete